MSGANQLVVNLDDGIGWHGETEACIRVGLGKDRRIDADDFAGYVDQRSTGVSRIDRGIGLNERLELAVGDDAAADGRNDAGRDRFLKTEGAANGNDPVAD